MKYDSTVHETIFDGIKSINDLFRIRICFARFLKPVLNEQLGNILCQEMTTRAYRIRIYYGINSVITVSRRLITIRGTLLHARSV